MGKTIFSDIATIFGAVKTEAEKIVKAIEGEASVIAKDFCKNLLPAITKAEQDVMAVIATIKADEPALIQEGEALIQDILAFKAVLAAL